MTSVYVDDRYCGAHGIGRYAREVLPRLGMPWTSLSLGGRPHSPVDAFRAVPVHEGIVYSPGYGALLRAPRQILTVHDLIHLQLPWPGRAKFVAYYNGPVRHTIRKAGLVLTVSQTSARAIREWVRDDRVHVIDAGNGCSPAFDADGPAAVSADPYVVFVGNLRPHKNLTAVLAGLGRAEGVRLRAVLPASEIADAAALANRLGVASRVDWVHGVDDDALAALYRGAVATVMPSTLEGFGLPALESIACGVPVIFWSGCRAVAEIVGDSGWAVGSAHDEAEWGEALVRAASERRRVTPPIGAHDWDRTARIVTDVIERARG